jgi:hypothetical protein
MDTYGHLFEWQRQRFTGEDGTALWRRGKERRRARNRQTEGVLKRLADKNDVPEGRRVRKCSILSGERGRNRTFNLLIKSQLLCQLSYAPGSWNQNLQDAAAS